MKKTYLIILLTVLSVTFSNASNGMSQLEANVDDVSFINAPLTVPSAQQYDFSVNYVASAQRDVYVTIYRPDWSWVASSKVTVAQGQGDLNFILNLSEPLAAGSGYHWKCSIRPFNTGWEQEISNETINNVIVEAPATDEISFLGAPRSVIRKTLYPLVVQYDAKSKRDLYVQLYDANWNWLGSKKKTVNAGSGIEVLILDLEDAPAAGTDYKWRCDIRPHNASWQQTIDSQIIESISITGQGMDKINFSTMSESVASSQNYTIDVVYSATERREVYVNFYAPDWTWLGVSSKVIVETGSGNLSVPVNLSQAPQVGSGYHWKCEMRPLSGGWQNATSNDYSDQAITSPASLRVITSPSPATDYINFSIEGEQHGYVIIYDQRGRIVERRELDTFVDGNTQVSWDLNTAPVTIMNGIYMYKIISASGLNKSGRLLISGRGI